MSIEKAFLHRGELWLVRFDVNIDILQLADFLAITVDEHFAVPLGHIPLGRSLTVGHNQPPRCLGHILPSAPHEQSRTSQRIGLMGPSPMFGNQPRPGVLGYPDLAGFPLVGAATM